MPVDAQKTICQNVPKSRIDSHVRRVVIGAKAAHIQHAPAMTTRFITSTLWRCHSKTLAASP
jgi:hypothetical protein